MVRGATGGPRQRGAGTHQSIRGTQKPHYHRVRRSVTRTRRHHHKSLIYACRTLIVPEIPCTPTDAVRVSLKSLATRCRDLDDEAQRLERHIDAIATAAVPQLRAVYGVGPDNTATLLAAIGDNPLRFRSDAAFAKICGVSPPEASSGKVVRHRLNRDANRALRTILVVRMRRQQPTRDYLARSLAEGKAKRKPCSLPLPRNLPRPTSKPRNRPPNIGASYVADRTSLPPRPRSLAPHWSPFRDNELSDHAIVNHDPPNQRLSPARRTTAGR